MKHSRIMFILIIVATFLFSGCASQQSNVAPEAAALKASNIGQPAPYFIQPGDQLDIKFFYNPELNETLTVRPDGKISLQLVDEVQAAGLKPLELDDVLTKKYAYELKKPMITVIVKSFAGQRIYVGGEVYRQGLMTLTGAMTPLQAVFYAGGFKETAKPGSTIIIRKGPGNKPVPIKMDLGDAMRGKAETLISYFSPMILCMCPSQPLPRPTNLSISILKIFYCLEV